MIIFPYQAGRRLFVGAAADFTVIGGVGSYALTGAAATLKSSRPLVAAPGSYALTGSDATLTKVSVGGAPSIAVVGTQQGALGNPTYEVPVGYAANDVALLLVETANEVVTTPTGYTALTAYGAGTGGDVAATRVSSFWKRLAASEAGAEIADAGDHVLCRMVIVRGCTTSGTPVSVLNGVAGSVTANPISFGAMSTALANTLVLHVISDPEDLTTAFMTTGAWSSPNLTDTDEEFDAAAGSGNGGGMAGFSGVKATAGTLGTVTGTTTRTLPRNMARVTFAFVP